VPGPIFTAVRDDSGPIVDFRWDYANTTVGVMIGSPTGRRRTKSAGETAEVRK
jgi:hypothetical protein